MKNKLFISIFITAFTHAQKNVRVYVQENKHSYPNKNFWFKKIIDNRSDKENIGIVYNEKVTEQIKAIFDRPLSSEFIKFYNRTYPNSQSKNQILCVVNKFEIGQYHTSDFQDSGFVILDIDFYGIQNDSVTPLAHYYRRLSEFGKEIASTHSNRIKRILLFAITDNEAKFNAISYTNMFPLSKLSNTDNKLKQENKIQSASDTNKTNIVSKPVFDFQKRFEDSINAIRPSKSIPGISVSFNFNTTTVDIGFNFFTLFRSDKNFRNLFGFSGGFTKIIFIAPPTLPEYTVKWKLFCFVFSPKFMRQLHKNVFLNFEPHVMLGNETYTNIEASALTGISNPVPISSLPTQDVSSFFSE